jgi:hypothetical protein
LIGVVAGIVAVVAVVLIVAGVRRRRMGLAAVAAPLLPNEDAVQRSVSEAAELEGRLRGDAYNIHDQEVVAAILKFCGELEKLISYVEKNPFELSSLTHVVNIYADQCLRAADNWVELEGSRSGRTAEVKPDLLTALDGANAAVESELGNATSGRAGQIEAASEAIKRLAAMDGYGVGSAPKVEDVTAPPAANADEAGAD